MSVGRKLSLRIFCLQFCDGFINRRYCSWEFDQFACHLDFRRLSTIALTNKIGNSRIGLSQYLLIGQEDDAEVLRAGFLAES